MILHTLEGGGGVGHKYEALRTVICDSFDQPLLLVAHLGDLGSPVIVVHRGEKGFDDMIELIPGLSPAKAVDIPFSLNKKSS